MDNNTVKLQILHLKIHTLFAHNTCGDMRCLNEVERKRRLSLDVQSVCER